jgi:hypothetical protein
MNTQKKLYLLPHRCQLIGWILVGVSLVFAVGCLLFIKGQSDRETYAGLGVILSFIGLSLAGLSRERQEDEFTVFLRTRSALTAVAFMFALKVVIALIAVTLTELTHLHLIGEEVFVNNRSVAIPFLSLKEMTGYGGAFILYLLLYKIRLARYYKEVNDEE